MPRDPLKDGPAGYLATRHIKHKYVSGVCWWRVLGLWLFGIIGRRKGRSSDPLRASCICFLILLISKAANELPK
ncbi:UNVERIFIED_CONTAM: hypothetical protein K2H54_008846, partial [Gekko kuhli]